MENKPISLLARTQTNNQHLKFFEYLLKISFSEDYGCKTKPFHRLLGHGETTSTKTFAELGSSQNIKNTMDTTNTIITTFFEHNLKSLPQHAVTFLEYFYFSMQSS